MAKVAIYTRKSHYNEDSISIETQIEMCKKELKVGECFEIYQDNGFSGKNTDRPDFQRLINDIADGKIKKVIVYKLDRISRNVLDFCEMYEVFEMYGVDFISSVEHFDTSTAIGKAMILICMVFAQMERETIAARIKDAYNSRTRKGYFGGGRIPFGYKKVPCVIDGKHTSKYEAVPEPAEIIRMAYEIYSKPNTTLGDVLEAIQEKGNTDIKWSRSHISRLLKNPAYTNATIDIYQFFKAQNAEIINAPEEYDGTKSMMLYEGESEDWRTSTDKGRYLVLVPHEGIVAPDVWLNCRKKFAKNRQVKTTTAKNSWLAGKIKCGHCGYGLTVRANEYKTRYVNCTGRAQYRVCKAKLPVIKADELEQKISREIKNKLEELRIHGKSEKENAKVKRIDELTAEIQGIDNNIKKLIALSLESTETTVKYLNESISELDEKKQAKQLEIEQLRSELRKDISKNIVEITNAASHWDDLSFDDKRGVVNILINKILVYENDIKIDWTI